MAEEPLKIYKPTVIGDNPFPNQEEGELDTSQKTSNEEYQNTEIADQPLPTGVVASDVVSRSLNTISGKITNSFQFTQSGAIQIGSYKNGVSGDIRISPDGITARNTAGEITFAIDGTTGDATYKGTITAGSVLVDTYIQIGSGTSVFKADNFGIYLGNETFGLAPFRVTPAGAVTASSLVLTNASIGAGSSYTGTQIAEAYIGNLNASKITAGDIATARLTANTLTALQASISNLSAIVVNAGNIQVGGSGDSLGTIVVKNSSGTEITKLNNNGIIIRNTRGLFFEQTSAGSFWDFSVNGSNQAVTSLPSTNQFFMKDFAGTTNLFTVSNSLTYSERDIETNSKLIWYDSKLSSGKSRYVFQDTGGAERFSITPDASPNTKLNMNGFELKLSSNKTAIVSTSQGFNALYSAEAPEVWFFDFCDDKESIDPLFLEVTSGRMNFIKLDGGGYQVWRRRKGHEDLRFTPKTAQEFEKNESFLRMSKI